DGAPQSARGFGHGRTHRAGVALLERLERSASGGGVQPLRESPDVIDDIRAGVDRLLGDGWLEGVNGEWDVRQGRAHRGDSGENAGKFILGRDRGCAWPRGFAADVD